MDKLEEAISRMRDKIWEEEGISQLPDVKKFLEIKGLTSIRELDDKGNKELKRHLIETALSATIPIPTPIPENKIN